jgi:two-component system cell cycle response regulator
VSDARILVVDDNAANLDLILYLLRAFGYEADEARDGLEGWEAARTGKYDLILTDILMPGIDGYEFARRLGGLSKRPRIVAVTALAMAGDRDRMLAAGFDDYLSKPIDPAAFRRYIEEALGEHPGR